jgi:biopolymer transport protein ExbD
VPARLQRADAYRKLLTPPPGGVFFCPLLRRAGSPRILTPPPRFPAHIRDAGIARDMGGAPMAFAGDSRNTAFATINITPLVDVMLVLLVIFMIAAPLLTRTIGVDLPGAAPPTRTQPSAAIALRIDAAGTVYWNGNATPLSALQPMLQSELQRNPGNPPLLKVDASGDTDYGIVAKVLAAARNAQWERIAFVLE